jgi:disulfide bond formation protein DsbB
MPSIWSLFLILILLAAAIHLIVDRKSLSRTRVLEILIIWSLVIGFGVGGVFSFFGHTFMADEIAASIGWPAGNPFQQEVAFANLAIGVLGLLAFRFRDSFWLAAIIAGSVFFIGAGLGHLHQIYAYGNLAPNNAGMVLVFDIALPVALMLMYAALAVLRRKSPGSQDFTGAGEASGDTARRTA